MTRVHFSSNSPKRGDISLTDSWPLSRSEGTHLHSFLPWEVPKERKNRGMLKRGRDCYDPHEGNIYTSEGGEVTTHNRYSPLVNCNDKMKEVLHNMEKPPDSSPDQDKKNSQSLF